MPFSTFLWYVSRLLWLAQTIKLYLKLKLQNSSEKITNSSNLEMLVQVAFTSYGFQLLLFGYRVFEFFLIRSLVLSVRLAGMLSLLEWVAQANSLLHDWLLLLPDTRFSRSHSQGKAQLSCSRRVVNNCDVRLFSSHPQSKRKASSH